MKKILSASAVSLLLIGGFISDSLASKIGKGSLDTPEKGDGKFGTQFQDEKELATIRAALQRRSKKFDADYAKVLDPLNARMVVIEKERKALSVKKQQLDHYMQLADELITLRLSLAHVIRNIYAGDKRKWNKVAPYRIQNIEDKRTAREEMRTFFTSSVFDWYESKNNNNIHRTYIKFFSKFPDISIKRREVLFDSALKFADALGKKKILLPKKIDDLALDGKHVKQLTAMVAFAKGYPLEYLLYILNYLFPKSKNSNLGDKAKAAASGFKKTLDKEIDKLMKERVDLAAEIKKQEGIFDARAKKEFTLEDIKKMKENAAKGWSAIRKSIKMAKTKKIRKTAEQAFLDLQKKALETFKKKVESKSASDMELLKAFD